MREGKVDLDGMYVYVYVCATEIEENANNSRTGENMRKKVSSRMLHSETNLNK